MKWLSNEAAKNVKTGDSCLGKSNKADKGQQCSVVKLLSVTVSGKFTDLLHVII